MERLSRLQRAVAGGQQLFSGPGVALGHRYLHSTGTGLGCRKGSGQSGGHRRPIQGSAAREITTVSLRYSLLKRSASFYQMGPVQRKGAAQDDFLP